MAVIALLGESEVVSKAPAKPAVVGSGRRP